MGVFLLDLPRSQGTRLQSSKKFWTLYIRPTTFDLSDHIRHSKHVGKKDMFIRSDMLRILRESNI